MNDSELVTQVAFGSDRDRHEAVNTLLERRHGEPAWFRVLTSQASYTVKASTRERAAQQVIEDPTTDGIFIGAYPHTPREYLLQPASWTGYTPSSDEGGDPRPDLTS